jgi:hypothetical protein
MFKIHRRASKRDRLQHNTSGLRKKRERERENRREEDEEGGEDVAP